MDATDFLDRAGKGKRKPVYAIFGDEDFLKRQVRSRIITQALDGGDPTLALSVYSGDQVDLSTIRNDLGTLPFLSPCRIVVIENADKFITENRQELEHYVAQPSSVGTLILDSKTFPESTKLAKLLPSEVKISCKAISAWKLPDWCIKWTKAEKEKKLGRDAAALLVELVGDAMGILAQEIEKIAIAIGARETITVDDVSRLVPRTKAGEVFRIMDLIGEGKAREALEILENLFCDGNDPLAVMGPLAWQMRRLAAVGRAVEDGLGVADAIDRAGIPGFARASTEKQVRWLGRRRLAKLSEWNAEINFGLKGNNALPPRIQVEHLFVKLARPRE